MTNSAGAVQKGLVLRMSVPAAGQMAAIGPELASKLGEQLGLSTEAAGAVGQAITDLSAKLADRNGDMEFEFNKLDAHLEIVARGGDRRETTRVPLHD
jgi:hypothetical protein